MKFARDFQTSLQEGNFPQEWIDSAIAYRKLKKCIKKIRQELEDLGLNHEALEALRTPRTDIENGDGGPESIVPGARPIQYTFQSGGSLDFMPKLTLALDRNGSPIDAWLSADTRHNLHRLVVDQRERRRASATSLDSPTLSTPLQGDQKITPCGAAPNGDDAQESSDEPDTIEIPLEFDLEFFQNLRQQLLSLEHLQKQEQRNMKSQIVKLGHELQDMKSSNSRRSKANIEVWREIFRQYVEAQIFFSSSEQDAGARDADHAQKLLQHFKQSLATENRSQATSDKLVGAALDRFLRINRDLLLLVKYQELNRTAVSKILKKFDKRTALLSQAKDSQWLTKTSFIAEDLAKATCFTISEELLHIIPQLDDYLCPICFNISFKPIRLRCNHVFCIRCLVVMQKANQNHCPLCRGEVVMEATSDNLDKKLMIFLKDNFPKDVKQKQKANEIAAGIDQFGEGFEGTHRCAVM